MSPDHLAPVILITAGTIVSLVTIATFLAGAAR